MLLKQGTKHSAPMFTLSHPAPRVSVSSHSALQQLSDLVFPWNVCACPRTPAPATLSLLFTRILLTQTSHFSSLIFFFFFGDFCFIPSPLPFLSLLFITVDLWTTQFELRRVPYVWIFYSAALYLLFLRIFKSHFLLSSVPYCKNTV